MVELESVIKKARNLPALPQITSKLLKVFNDSSSQARDVSRIIESDQSLATQILKQVNSPFYGFAGRVANLQHAVVIMGFNAIRNLAIGFSMAKMSRKVASPALSTEQFWVHSLGVGVGARSIGKHIGYECPEELLAAGLVHDIGKLILADVLPDEYSGVLKEADKKGEEVYQSEKRLLGWSHNDVGEWYGKANRFPPLLRACIKYHHQVTGRCASEFTRVVHAVSLADQLCRREGIGWSGCSISAEDLQGTCRVIGLSDEARERVVQGLKGEVDAAKDFFGIVIPAQV